MWGFFLKRYETGILSLSSFIRLQENQKYKQMNRRKLCITVQSVKKRDKEQLKTIKPKKNPNHD